MKLEKGSALLSLRMYFLLLVCVRWIQLFSVVVINLYVNKEEKSVLSVCAVKSSFLCLLSRDEEAEAQ